MCWGKKNAGGRETPRLITDDAGPRVAVMNKCIVKAGKRLLTILQHFCGRAEDRSRASLNTDLMWFMKCIAK